jgi:TRAP-type C4-dicarboxylate transport system permease small subunit
MLFGLGWPQWLTIAALIGGLILTFKVMARASIAYEKARQAREQQQTAEEPSEAREDSQ